MSVAQEPRLATLLAEPHHDGSDAYVVERPERVPGTAVVRLRVPRGTAVDAVAVRRVTEGEARVLRAELDEETETDSWWRAELDVSGNATRYRWLLSGGDYGYAWVNGMGVVPYDPPDSDDFVLSLDPGGPDWHLGSVVYEIYPDRFARGGAAGEPPKWAVPREWDELPTGRGKTTSREWFGGDLAGIEQRLDHIESLGANVLYLTPFFPARSTHRYDATTFDRVDPLLGGDAALSSLANAVHRRGLKLVGDLTTNHTGVGHEWFEARDPVYYFDDSLPHGYQAWLGIPSLPKLDWGTPALRSRMAAVARRWLDAGLDGWRIDVANMTGRLGDADANADVARALREVVGPERVLVGEHFHDYRLDLAPGGWHGVMNYAGFLKPAWTWLRGEESRIELDLPFPLPRLDGTLIATTMRAFRAGVPWQGTLHSWALLDSHDTARFRTVAGSRELQLVGIGLQLTTPGVPMLFAGDELGLEGRWGEDARRPMPWSRPDSWDAELLAAYRALIALRRSLPALARGGIRYAHVDADVLCYLRETRDERLLCLAARAPHDPIRVPFRSLEKLYGDDAEDGVLPAGGPSFHVWRIHG